MKTTVSHPPLAEADVADAVDAFLRERGYAITRQLKIRTWRPDLVAVKEDEVVIIETKGRFGDLRKAMAQTALYATDGSAAYLAIPTARVDERLRGIAETLGIGLIEVNEKVRIVVRAPVGTARTAFLNRARRAVGRPEATVPAQRRRPTPWGRVLRHRRVLETLLANPRRRFTIRELSIESGTPYATTWRTVEELRALGGLTSERVGTSQYLSVNAESAFMKDLGRIPLLELSPHRTAAREFAGRLAELSQVRKVALFGSVAEGRETAGSDVDVAVVLARKSERATNRILAVATEVQDRTGMRVVPLFITPGELRSRGQLADAIRAGEVLYDGS